MLFSVFSVFQRIAGITAMLQQSLEGLLIQGLQTTNIDIVRHCLRTYATIDKTRDAEALVGQVLVKPYMDEVDVAYHPVTAVQSIVICISVIIYSVVSFANEIQAYGYKMHLSFPSECRFLLFFFFFVRL